eukprot:TRINITY_DN3109_c0_g1_i8.p1 TRINITY_DN3109_c0_g1~~TRINITY_DN3109_c0_g1_i8.p1  ORF type:complete len:263 (-),score=49.35 TRINITY_DN3109_c0_g1_i8:334-1122(-)
MKPIVNQKTTVSHSTTPSKSLSKKLLHPIPKPPSKPSKQRLLTLALTQREPNAEFPVGGLEGQEAAVRAEMGKGEKVQVEGNGRSRLRRTVKRSGRFGPDFVCLDELTKRSRKRRVPENGPLGVEKLPVKKVRMQRKSSQKSERCGNCGNRFKAKTKRAAESGVPPTLICRSCKDPPKKRKDGNGKEMSPLDLLILAVENNSKEAGKKMSLSEGRESVTLQSDIEKSWEEAKATAPHFVLSLKTRPSLKSFLQNTPQLHTLR